MQEGLEGVRRQAATLPPPQESRTPSFLFWVPSLAGALWVSGWDYHGLVVKLMAQAFPRSRHWRLLPLQE